MSSPVVPHELQQHLDEVFAQFLNLKGVSLMPERKDDIAFRDIMLCEDASSQLRAGDHLAFQIRQTGAYHHVIYMGEGSIIDNNDSKMRNSITRRSWEDLIKDYYRPEAVVHRILYPDNDAGDRRRMALKVAEILSCPSHQISYNVIGLNCEAFAAFCWTGEWCVPILVQTLPCRQQCERVTGPYTSTSLSSMQENK